MFTVFQELGRVKLVNFGKSRFVLKSGHREVPQDLFFRIFPIQLKSENTSENSTEICSTDVSVSISVVIICKAA